MSETSRRGFDGLALDGKLNADATVQNPNDLDSPVTVMVRGPQGNYTVMFQKPGQAASFESKHTRRIRRNSITGLTSDQISASGKMNQYAEEASKHAARRWQNAGDKNNTLVFLTLDGFCKLAAYVVDQIGGRNWHPYGNPARQQMDLMFVMHECLAFKDNGFGQASNAGVGVRFQITVEQDPQNAHVLYVVHLESSEAWTKLDTDTMSAPKNAQSLGQAFTNVGGALGH